MTRRRRLRQTPKPVALPGWERLAPGWWVHRELGAVAVEANRTWTHYRAGPAPGSLIENGPYRTKQEAVDAAVKGVRP